MPRDMPCVLQTRVSSLAHEKFQNEARKLGVSAADLLRIVVLRVIQKDISVEAVVSFKKGMDSVQEMKKLRRGEKHELLDVISRNELDTALRTMNPRRKSLAKAIGDGKTSPEIEARIDRLLNGE